MRIRLPFRRTLPEGLRPSYAQCGEDVIVDHLLRNLLGVEQPTYLDLGAHAPRRLSNTYLFYRRGCRGTLVEPDPTLAQGIARDRTEDEVLNIGVTDEGDRPHEADFFIMAPATLNTFCRDEAEQYANTGSARIVETRKVEVWPMPHLIQHVGEPPALLSVDVEGIDHRLLAAADLDTWRPTTICVETLRDAYRGGKESKDRELIALVRRHGYVRYSDTYINTIFVAEESWAKRSW